MKDSNDVLKEWIDFREEKLSNLNEEDKKHFIYFEEIEEKILNSIPKDNRSYVREQLSILNDNFIDYNYYWNQKYYRNGFQDAIQILN